MAAVYNHQAADIQMEETAMTDLHLVSWDRPKMTELVIKTIHRNTKRDNFRLVVLDNASNEATVEMLESLHANGLIDELILIKTNLGLEAARNLLLNNVTQSEYFVCIDNDCLPPPIKDGADWLENLTDLMQKYENFAAISMRTQVMIGTGNIFEDSEGDDLVPFPHPGGSFRLMRTGDVLAVGGWDRKSPGRGSEERYICGKLIEEGWSCGFAVNIKCLHLFGTRGDNPTDRWGYHKDMKPEDTGHSDISHPALEQGDFKDEVLLYADKGDADDYFSTA